MSTGRWQSHPAAAQSHQGHGVGEVALPDLGDAGLDREGPREGWGVASRGVIKGLRRPRSPGPHPQQVSTRRPGRLPWRGLGDRSREEGERGLLSQRVPPQGFVALPQLRTSRREGLRGDGRPAPSACSPRSPPTLPNPAGFQDVERH